MGFARFGKPLRAQPQARFNKDCALLFGPSMAGGLAGGAEICPAVAASEGPNGGWGIWRPEDGCTDLWDGFACQLGHNCQPAHIGRLALICGHAQRGVAFEMFNTDKVFLMGQFDVFNGHVVLLIEPGPVAVFDGPKGRDGDGRVLRLWHVKGGGSKPIVTQPAGGFVCAAAQRASGGEISFGRPRHAQGFWPL